MDPDRVEDRTTDTEPASNGNNPRGYIDTRLLGLIEWNTKWTVYLLGSCAIGIFMVDANLTRIFRELKKGQIR